MATLVKDLTYVLSPLEFIDVDIDDLGCSECLLQGSVVWVVLGCGLPKFPKQQGVLHNPLDWFDEQRTHVQQIGFPSAQHNKEQTMSNLETHNSS